jgi:hypothetical protein
MIQVSVDFVGLKDSDFLIRCRKVYAGMKENVVIFSSPSLDLEDLKTTTDQFDDARIRSMDSKKAIAERQGLKETLIRMLRQLAAYVESVATDISDVLASGFEPKYVSRQRSGPLERPSMKKLEHGPISGSIKPYFTAIDNARYYELRYAEFKPIIDESEWHIKQVFVARFPTTITGFKPGTVYAFQVRARGSDVVTNRAVATDWSDSMTIMCV